MDASPRCIELIHGSEGFKTKLPDGRYKSYLDTLPTEPVWTIYCGLTKGVGSDTIWTVEQCEKAFSKEMAFYEDAVDRMVTVPLNQNQFDALVSLVYNIGPGSPTDTKDRKGFYWSTLRRLLNQGNYEAAAAQFKRFNRSGGKVYNGLITRRAKEAALFMEPMPEPQPIPDAVTGVIPEKPPIPQSVDNAAPVVSIARAAVESPTVKVAAAAAPGGLIGLWYSIEKLLDFGNKVVTDAGGQILETQQSLTPFAAILKMTPTVLIAITLGAIGVAAARQIVKRRNGTAV